MVSGVGVWTSGSKCGLCSSREPWPQLEAVARRLGGCRTEDRIGDAEIAGSWEKGSLPRLLAVGVVSGRADFVYFK